MRSSTRTCRLPMRRDRESVSGRTFLNRVSVFLSRELGKHPLESEQSHPIRSLLIRPARRNEIRLENIRPVLYKKKKLKKLPAVNCVLSQVLFISLH